MDKICKVQYYKPELEAYSGMGYTYFTTLDLKVGDEVYAPTQKCDNRAIVIECGRTELTDAEMAFAHKIKTITKYFDKE
jgi:hypothetical protein